MSKRTGNSLNPNSSKMSDLLASEQVEDTNNDGIVAKDELINDEIVDSVSGADGSYEEILGEEKGQEAIAKLDFSKMLTDDERFKRLLNNLKEQAGNYSTAIISEDELIDDYSYSNGSGIKKDYYLYRYNKLPGNDTLIKDSAKAKAEYERTTN